jgi:hypothetical protein
MNEPQAGLPIGSYVRVASGCLAGVVGVVVEFTENNNHVLSVDGWGYDAHLLVSGNVLILEARDLVSQSSKSAKMNDSEGGDFRSTLLANCGESR